MMVHYNKMIMHYDEMMVHYNELIHQYDEMLYQYGQMLYQLNQMQYQIVAFFNRRVLFAFIFIVKRDGGGEMRISAIFWLVCIPSRHMLMDKLYFWEK
ncbi:MAG: hypothetical protein IPP77_05470 [Bacteroidetes bacterium]|nr:hypothetical protein [Bacteroidota bacterium]